MRNIVYVDVVGDLFHYGHCRYFEQARAYGDYLIVGVLCDEECEKYKRTPYQTLEERCESISWCKLVDEVVPVYGKPTTEFIHKHGISTVCHGDDIDDETRNSWYGDAIGLGIYRETRYTPSVSTSDLVRRIISRNLS